MMDVETWLDAIEARLARIEALIRPAEDEAAGRAAIFQALARIERALDAGAVTARVTRLEGQHRDTTARLDTVEDEAQTMWPRLESVETRLGAAAGG